jgi:hypothetical protein
MNPYPKLAEGMEINQVEDGYVVYQADRDRVHYLNHTAVLVLEGCTGSNRVEEIVELVRQAFHPPGDPEADVKTCLENLKQQGLVV